jgi:collagenase-like PrtC family protease
MLECVMDRLENTAELLKAPWIRPEDIAYYEKNFKIDKFKIQGRQMPVEWIVKTVEVYSNRKYEGNLLDIISPTYPNWSTRSTNAKQLLQKYNAEDFRRPDVYIDNNLLVEFFSTLVQKGGCSPTQQCSDCSYCDRVAEDLIQIKDIRQFETYATATKQLFEDMVRTPSA